MSYAAKYDVTADTLAEKIGIGGATGDLREIAVEALDLCEAAYSWGLRGWWPNQDFSSDADWVYGPGESILKLEIRLDCDDDPVFLSFQEAHSLGLIDGGHGDDE